MSPRRIAPGATLAGLACSAAALAIAPALMPTSYSWISHTTSESAAQGVPGAWLGRLGLTLFGLSVLGLAWFRRPAWGPWATGLHLCFGAFMVVAGAFSTRPWIGADYDRAEDLVHSVAATVIGFAFAFGVLLTALRRRRAAAPPSRRRGGPSTSPPWPPRCWYRWP